MVPGRLFVKIYLTLLACLAAVAIASAAYWWLSADREELGWLERRDRVVEAMLPATDTPVDWQRTLERISKGMGTDIALYGADNRLIASAGTPPPLLDDNGKSRHGPMFVKLSDGRTLVADLDRPWERRGGDIFGYLALIAAVIAAAAYPVVRNLTRRLEELRDGVKQFGEGALAARVPVEGRDEIAVVASSFNRAAERIERLVTAHRALLANASHELRSPLTRLRLAIDLGGAGASKAHDREILDNLREVDELVEEILLSSRLEHIGKLEKAVPVDLTALVAEECSRHGVETTGTPAHVSGDARLLVRLVRNLILNAARHGKPPIEVDVRSDGQLVRLTVRDHGDGIPDGEGEHIFEPFYRPTGRSESAGGWGLGLALVKEIAELHGGRVRCETPSGGGAWFVVELPMLRG